MVKIIMHGCNGHMGRTITAIVENDDECRIVAGVDKYTGTENRYPVFDDISKCDVKADVIIDFSSAVCCEGLLDYSQKTGIPIVLCTTGISDAQKEKIIKASGKVAILKSANMSLGINVLSKLCDSLLYIGK